MNNNKIAVVIPCYKVINQLENVLLTIPEFVDHIIVVDDACPQNSGKFAESLGLSNTIVLFHEKNQGVGGAVMTGYKKALELSADITIKLDGDGQMDPNDIDTLIEPILNKKADYTKGNRFHDFNALKNMPGIRLIGNSALSFINKFASGYWNIMDPTNGFCAISLKTLQQLNLKNIEKRYFFETDILIQLNLHNQVVKDVPISAIYQDEISNLSVSYSFISFPFKIVKGLVKRLFYKYYIYDFNMASIYLLVGIPLLLFGFTFGLYRWIAGYMENTYNSAGTIMLVALPIIIGIQFLLQAISIDINNTPQKK